VILPVSARNRYYNPTMGRWIRWFQSSADIALVCVPCAGGTPTLYERFAAASSHDFRVGAVLLAGRQQRVRERASPDILQIASYLATALLVEIDRPFVLFGHSMGAVIAYEAARRLEDAGRAPIHLVVLGHRAPHLPRRSRRISNLADDAFAAAVRRINPDLPTNLDLLSVVLPTVRADFAAAETYRPVDTRQLRCNVTALRARDDDGVTLDETVAWAEVTVGDFDYAVLDGGHMNIDVSAEALADRIARVVTRP